MHPEMRQWQCQGQANAIVNAKGLGRDQPQESHSADQARLLNDDFPTLMLATG
jgi:hypothetical protein